MARRGGQDLAVGVMFALALIIVSLTVMTVGGESKLFASKVDYGTLFPTAEGLVIGSPVKMSGVQIGMVTAIRLSTDPSESGIDVRLGVDEAYAGRVRRESRAAMRILQALSGEKFVEIVPGPAEAAVLEPGSMIHASQDPELLQQAAQAAENINTISVSTKNILAALERGDGLLGQMIIDPAFGKQGLESLIGALKNLEALTHDLREGRGFVGRMLSDERFAGQFDDLGEAMEHLAEVIGAVHSDRGALGALIEDGGAGQQAVEDLRDAAASFKRVGERLETPRGLVGRMLNDEEYSEAMAESLRATLANLASITGKIDDGRGTLGALINERVLYEGMEDVVAGVNDSKFARWLVRRYQKRGIKQELAGEADPEGGTGTP